MAAQPDPSPYWGAGIQELQAKAASYTPWIPASAGMTTALFSPAPKP